MESSPIFRPLHLGFLSIRLQLKVELSELPEKLALPHVGLWMKLAKPTDEITDVDEDGEEFCVYCKRGKRGAMEDRYSAVVCLQGDSKQLPVSRVYTNQ